MGSKNRGVIYYYIHIFFATQSEESLEERRKSRVIKKYSTKEVQDKLQISKDTWKRRREEILEYLKGFWVYEIVTEGRCNCFVVYNETEDLKPLPRKTALKEIKAFYSEKTDDLINNNPWNTGANIARQIIAKDNRYDHKEGTAANYVRPILKEEYTITEHKEWHKPNYITFVYEPLEEEEKEYLNELFKKYMHRLSSESIIEAIAAEDAGYCTKEEAYDQIKGTYNQVMNEFKEKYGYRPIKIGKYEKNFK